MTPLQSILTTYRATSQTEREKGSYFEELICTYFHYKIDLLALETSQIDWAKY